MPGRNNTQSLLTVVLFCCLCGALGLACASCAGTPATDPDVPPKLSPEGAANDTERAALIQWLSAYAVREQERTGVPASITIAQAILETGWLRAETPVRRRMVLEAKNLFGIKGAGPAGSVEIPTNEYESGHWITINAKFRAYHSYSESFADHSNLLTTSAYYSGAMKYRKDPHKYIREVAKNYATDPNYAEDVWSIVRRYNLQRYDRGD
jgi:flagellum-specific peptidoglycan hydrolase FlgJ